MKNLIVRTITGVLFVAIMVAGFLRPQAMIFLFALITGLTIWEYCGLVNDIKDVTVNRFISTVAGVYFFLAIAGVNGGISLSVNGIQRMKMPFTTGLTPCCLRCISPFLFQ